MLSPTSTTNPGRGVTHGPASPRRSGASHPSRLSPQRGRGVPDCRYLAPDQLELPGSGDLAVSALHLMPSVPWVVSFWSFSASLTRSALAACSSSRRAPDASGSQTSFQAEAARGHMPGKAAKRRRPSSWNPGSIRSRSDMKSSSRNRRCLTSVLPQGFLGVISMAPRTTAPPP
jgi:hypothetical protein